MKGTKKPFKSFSWNKEWGLAFLGVAGFNGFLFLTQGNQAETLSPITSSLFQLGCLLAIFPHYIFVILKIFNSTLAPSRKYPTAILIILGGHILAWIFTCTFSGRLQSRFQFIVSEPEIKRRSITEKIIHARIFKPITSRFKTLKSNDSRQKMAS